MTYDYERTPCFNPKHQQHTPTRHTHRCVLHAIAYSVLRIDYLKLSQGEWVCVKWIYNYDGVEHAQPIYCCLSNKTICEAYECQQHRERELKQCIHRIDNSNGSNVCVYFAWYHMQAPSLPPSLSLSDTSTSSLTRDRSDKSPTDFPCIHIRLYGDELWYHKLHAQKRYKIYSFDRRWPMAELYSNYLCAAIRLFHLWIAENSHSDIRLPWKGDKQRAEWWQPQPQPHTKLLFYRCRRRGRGRYFDRKVNVNTNWHLFDVQNVFGFSDSHHRRRLCHYSNSLLARGLTVAYVALIGKLSFQFNFYVRVLDGIVLTSQTFKCHKWSWHRCDAANEIESEIKSLLCRCAGVRCRSNASIVVIFPKLFVLKCFVRRWRPKLSQIEIVSKHSERCKRHDSLRSDGCGCATCV